MRNNKTVVKEIRQDSYYKISTNKYLKRNNPCGDEEILQDKNEESHFKRHFQRFIYNVTNIDGKHFKRLIY